MLFLVHLYSYEMVSVSLVARVFVYRRRAPAANAAMPDPSNSNEAGSGIFGGGVGVGGVGVGQFGHVGHVGHSGGGSLW